MDASSSELLILQLHGRLLRIFAVEAGQHFQGLAQAARFLKRSGRISAATANKLLKLDSAFNLVRHITAISVGRFEAHLVSELLQTSPVTAHDNHAPGRFEADPISELLHTSPKATRDSINHAPDIGRAATEWTNSTVTSAGLLNQTIEKIAEVPLFEPAAFPILGEVNSPHEMSNEVTAPHTEPGRDLTWFSGGASGLDYPQWLV